MEYFPTRVYAGYDPAMPLIPNCSIPIKESLKANTLVQTFDSGHEQRRPKSPPRRIFDLTYIVLKKNQYFTIRDFFRKVTNVTAFKWLHPVERVEYLVRFDMDTFAGEYFTHGASGPLYKLQLRLIEVWS